MAVLSDYTSGTITLANGSTAVTGTGTLFDVAKFREGDTLQIQNLTAVIASVNSNTSLTLTVPWSGTSLTDAPYRARYLPDGARVTAQATTLIELLGNGVLSNLAELGVEDGKVPVGNAAGEYELKDQSTFGVQDPNGSLGKLADLTLAARQILQTDENGALKALALAANKFLRTDANGDLALSDLGAAAIALLNLSGTAAADRLPYLTGVNGAGLTVLSAFARSILDDANGDAVWNTMGGGGSGVGGTTAVIVLPNGYKIMQWATVPQTNAAGGFNVTYPVAFTSRPASVMFMDGERNAGGALSKVFALLPDQVSATTAGGIVFNSTSGTGLASTTVRVECIAIGY
ncbi:gp53-like domain-containing protein [Brucella rhizosphaerae]|uniref:gp53-like domain-containing protein n=1 Tax=Brucella rhizosphaerae TaxID=571254 RepID=UPI000466738C|nr:hypothetical protein [Brucella rhizosphaerae]